MEKVKIFFWYCSGANISLLKQCETEHSKFVGIGATILFTGLFAALAAGYAFFTVFDSILIATLLGLVWGIMIFNLDRFIVSSMRKSDKPWSGVKMAMPRIILAVLISIVIAKPLELKVFEKEITGELSLMQEELYSAQDSLIKEKFKDEQILLRNEVSDLEKAIAIKTKQRDTLRLIAQQEADGTGGTGKRNAGPIYQIKKANADKVDQELADLVSENNALITEKRNRLTALDAQQQTAITSLERNDISGPAARLDALSRLTLNSTAIWWANVFIIFLFIVIETSPILVKLMSPKGPYDYLLETTEYRFETDALKDKAFIHDALKKESEHLAKKEQTFVTNQLDMKLDSV